MKIYLGILFCTLFVISLPNSFGQTFDEYGIKVETIADNLQIPWEMVFSPDGRIFFTERVGNLRVIENGQLNSEPIASFSVGGGEGGLLGLALDPNFKENHYLYLYQTYSEFFSTFNKVVRYKESDNKLSEEKILVDRIPGASYHDGGRIKFGPDGKIYITTGDAGNYNLAQDLNSNAGKILRINSDGSIPQDNPFENSLVFSYGHRNPQGIDWDPITGKMLESEHGPSGEKGAAHDEINIIKKGENYGWPEIVGNETKQGMIIPILQSGDDTWAPSGISFYKSDKIPTWNGKLFVATLRGSHLKILDVDSNQNKVISQKNIFVNEFGRLRDVVSGPDGYLYILTSNNDGRGSQTGTDDRILRILPMSENKEFADSRYATKIGVEITQGAYNRLCATFHNCYSPEKINIKTGDTVTWANKDSEPHTVTSGEPGKPDGYFDSGLYKPNESWSFTFTEPGIFNYYCTIHPWMAGKVSVTGNAVTIQIVIPQWIKNNAGWWADGSVDDFAFVQGIQYLIKEKIMKIPPTSQGSSPGSNEIPSWIKNNAGWWASDQIRDSDFIQGIQYLIINGIIQI